MQKPFHRKFSSGNDALADEKWYNAAMAMRVLISPDKFKGTLTARAAAEAIARGWHRARPDDAVDLLPITDGGDGFGEVTRGLLRARTQTVATVDAAHRRCRAQWWWEPKRRTAIIESAGVIGLARLPAGRFHPFALDTFGLGAVIRAALRRGARRCVLGIGGSATNDGGFGVARALGWEFLDGAENAITSWTELERLARLNPPPRKKSFRELIVAVDVQNPLLGARGCSRIYGPQKGLRPGDFTLAEKCLRQLVKVAAQLEFRTSQSGSLVPSPHEERIGRGVIPSSVAGFRAAPRPTRNQRDGGENSLLARVSNCARWDAGDPALQPGAGAAGGLGFGLRVFLGARLEPGFELFARMADLTSRLKDADLVITGEGAIDPSTTMGKGVGELARRCRELRIPCIGLAGKVVQSRGRKQIWFAAQHALTELTTANSAKAKPAFWLEKLAARVAANPTIQSLRARPPDG
jgi:glycerate kinase